MCMNKEDACIHGKKDSNHDLRGYHFIRRAAWTAKNDARTHARGVSGKHAIAVTHFGGLGGRREKSLALVLFSLSLSLLFKRAPCFCLFDRWVCALISCFFPQRKSSCQKLSFYACSWSIWHLPFSIWFMLLISAIASQYAKGNRQAFCKGWKEKDWSQA